METLDWKTVREILLVPGLGETLSEEVSLTAADWVTCVGVDFSSAAAFLK